MGNCAGNLSEPPSERHRDIEKSIREEKKALLTEMKILLLGAGDTGKSTLVKQIKLIYKSGFSQAEREIFRDIIATNTLIWMHLLINGVSSLSLNWSNESNKETSAKLVSQIEGHSLPSLDERFKILLENRQVLLDLWEDEAIQEAFTKSHVLQLGESAPFFLNSLARIASKDYLPTDEDILLARTRTSGIVETSFEDGGCSFKVVDVGGQRSERRKWIHCFQEVTLIIFFAALSEYNMVLYEERGVNRMKESLKLFHEIVNCVWFRETPVVLFLNKCDLFEDKIKKHPLKEFFAEYDGGDDYKKGCDYVKNMFLSLNQVEKRPIYPYITCCTDTKQVKTLLESVRDVVLRTIMEVSFRM